MSLLLLLLVAPGFSGRADETPATEQGAVEPPAGERPAASATSDAATADGPVDSRPRVSLAVARDRAQVLGDVYLSTLHVMHDRYFHGDRAVVPARAMEDVFSDVQRQSHVEARWFAVSLNAMSIDHEPKSTFEEHAARRIKAGQQQVEAVEEGYYRRAVAVSLGGGCLHCHEGFGKTSTVPRFAGLVISIPVEPGARLEADGESGPASDESPPTPSQ